MELIADALLAAGAFGAGLYCYILQGRLKRFSTLESGMGGAIAVLSAQVDDMTRALQVAQTTASESSTALDAQVSRAESAAARLNLMLAAMHDLPDSTANNANGNLRVIRRRNPRMETAE